VALATNAANRTTHGHARKGSQSPEYRAWKGMKNRCSRKADRRYADYGGRGIAFDPRWGDFASFLEDMGPRPSAYHSLDRIDNDGDYTPINCRWATREQQAQNKRTTRLTPVSVMCLRVLHGRGADVSVLAGAFGVSTRTVEKVVTRVTWKNVA
jgi:hypothetical protein